MRKITMNVQQKMEEINQTDYWDLGALEFRTNYLGDEASLFIELYENGKIDDTFVGK